MLEHGVRISVCCMHIFLHAHWKGSSLIYDVRNYHKKSNYVRKWQIFTAAIKPSLISAGVLS
jgi:hypothetical protein